VNIENKISYANDIVLMC